MGNQPGKLMIIQREDLANPGQWLNLCGFDSTNFRITNAITSEERVNCATREAVVDTIKEYGAQNIVFDGTGIFDDDANGTWAHTQAVEQNKVKLRAFVPGLMYLECDEWLVASDELSGTPNNSLTQSISFEASGTTTPTWL